MKNITNYIVLFLAVCLIATPKTEQVNAQMTVSSKLYNSVCEQAGTCGSNSMNSMNSMNAAPAPATAKVVMADKTSDYSESVHDSSSTCHTRTLAISAVWIALMGFLIATGLIGAGFLLGLPCVTQNCWTIITSFWTLVAILIGLFVGGALLIAFLL